MTFRQKGSSRCLGFLNCRSISKLSQRKASQVKIIEKPERFWVFRAATLQKWKNSHLQPTLTNLRHSFYKPKVWRTLSWVDCGICWYNNFTQKKDQTSCFPQMLLPNNLCHLELYKSSMPIIRSVRISYLFLFFNIFVLEIWGFLGLISRCCRYVLYFSNGCLEQRCPTMHSPAVISAEEMPWNSSLAWHFRKIHCDATWWLKW